MHDGKPFTSADVAWGLRNVNNKYNGKSSRVLKNVTRVDTLDEHTAIPACAAIFLQFQEAY
jgi:ABC-type transport system substrate-binding protein